MLVREGTSFCLIIAYLSRSPRAGIAQAAVANASCSLQNATYAGRILKNGGLNIKPSSEACWKECKCAQRPETRNEPLVAFWLPPFQIMSAHLGLTITRSSADGVFGGDRHTEKCNAWTWCADELGCMDENGRLMPFKGCQLKDEPMQAWGLPSQRQVASHKIANYFSGYLRRAHSFTPITMAHPSLEPFEH